MLTALGRLSPALQRIILVLASAVLFGLWLQSVPLTEIDETRYSEATREMLESGNYIIPYFNYEPRYKKPILYYWIQAASVKAFGQNEVAARLPSAAATTLTVLAVHAFLLYWLRKCAGKDPVAQQEALGAAFLGGVACATTLFAVVWGRAATTDATLTMFMTFATLALLQAELVRTQDVSPSPLPSPVKGEGVSAPSEPASAAANRSNDNVLAVRRWYLVAAVAAGLAFLTKGPIGLALPGMTWLLYHLRNNSLLSEAKRVPWVGALALFVLVGAPWYVATYVVDGDNFVRHFFLKENVARFSSTAMEGHGASNRLLGLLVYPLVSLIFLYPYSAFLASDLVKASCSSSDDTLFRIRRFAWAWMLAVIGVFSISKTQLPSYIHSTIGAAGILFAVHIFNACNQSRKSAGKSRLASAIEAAIVLIFGLALAAGAVYVFKHGSIKGRLGEWPFAHPAVDVVTIAMAGAGLLMLAVIIAGKLSRKPGQFAALTVGGWTVFLVATILFAAPLIVRTAQGPSREIGAFLRSLPAGEPVFAPYGKSSENLVYYGQRKIIFRNKERSDTVDQAKDILAASGRMVIVTDMETVDRLSSFGRVSILKTHGPIVIARLEKSE